MMQLKTDRVIRKLQKNIGKLTVMLLWLLPLFVSAQLPVGNKNNDAFAAIEAGFRYPPQEYATCPFWVWNTRITRPVIDSMLLDYKAKGFGGVFVHPRPGLITEYLSKEWLDCFAYAVNVGKKLGLYVWMYDENSYPTGFAGGLLNEQMPQSYNEGQLLTMKKKESLDSAGTGVFICLKKDTDRWVNITAEMDKYRNTRGVYCLFYKENYKISNRGTLNGPVGFSYVDLMRKGVTEKFIDITFSGYKKVAGKEFGQTVPGVFSDEPSIITEKNESVRWTPDLFAAFKKKWGYNLEENLPSLFEETGDWMKVRHNHYQVLLELFTERWSKPMHRFMTENNLKWTGHYWEHGWPDTYHCPDNMAMYAWHEQPGIDMLFNQFDEGSPHAQFGNIRSVRELASVANQLNKTRTLSETYGGSGWEVTFKDLKRLGDWEFVLGVNYMNQHLSLMSLTASRKYDYPPSFSYHNPWFKYYKPLNDYFRRLSFVLSHGREQNDILILEPTTSAWMYSLRGKNNQRMQEIGATFQQYITRLQKAQLGFDLGSEYIIEHNGRVEQGLFKVGAAAYKTVVIPPGMDNVNLPTFRLLQKFQQAGGNIISLQQINRLNGAEAGSLLSNFYASTLHLPADQADTVWWLANKLADTACTIRSTGGNLYHQRRKLRDGQLVLLTNASMDSTVTGQITATGQSVKALNLFTGAIEAYTAEKNNGKLVIPFSLSSAGSLLLFISATGDAAVHTVKQVTGQPVKTGGLVIERPLQNELAVDFCTLTMGDSTYANIHINHASDLLFRKNGFNKNPWSDQTQFRQAIVARDTFSKATAFTVAYNFFLEEQLNDDNFRLVIEQAGLWDTVRINGHTINPLPGQWWLDRSFGVCSIGRYVRKGENTVTLSKNNMSVFAEISPIYLLGNFSLSPRSAGWGLRAPEALQLGSWRSQGMPMYSHGVVYRKEVYLPGGAAAIRVKLGQWKGTVAAVKLNGVYVDNIISANAFADITKGWKKGKNTLEIEIVGSLKNLLGPYYNKPRPGLAAPGLWNNIHYPVPGTAYDLYDYGLFEDFSVEEIK